MKPDKKQTVQLLVLGVLVVLFIGFLSFNFMAPKKAGKAQPSTGDTKPATASVAPAVEPEADEAPARVAEVQVFPDLASVPARRDPFVPQRLPGTEIAARPAPVKWSGPSPKMLSAFKTSMAKVPSMSIPPINPFRGGQSTVVRSAIADEPEPDPKFVVTGILRGDENVVIIKSEDNNRYVVKQGQMIEGRYKVLYVTQDGVVLAHKNRRIHVKLGGDKNAS